LTGPPARDEIVAGVLAKIEADPANRDRVLAEIYATCHQLEDVLAMMIQAGPAGMFRTLVGFGRRRPRGNDTLPAADEIVVDKFANVGLSSPGGPQDGNAS
jgi:hypothetical protein